MTIKVHEILDFTRLLRGTYTECAKLPLILLYTHAAHRIGCSCVPRRGHVRKHGKCNTVSRDGGQGADSKVERMVKRMERIKSMMRISEVKEVSLADEATRLMQEEGWRYLTINTSASPTSYILCKFTEREPE